MMEADDFKQLTLEILWDGKHINRFVCELRFTLFLKALNVANQRPDCLMPFPFYFYERGVKNTALLRQHIDSIPPFDEIKDSTQFPLLTWQLLYWIFTNPLTITALHLKEPQKIFVERMIEETKLTDIPCSDPSMVYFKIDTQTPKEKFLEGRAKHGSFFAFHGSGVENFHSIIHRGLVCALNQRSSYGFGTYLTLNYDTAFGFATHSIVWEHCKLLSKQRGVGCVAIVEVVDDPSINWPYKATLGYTRPNNGAEDVDLWTRRKQCYCCVVDRDELMQLRYLLLTH